MEYYAIPLEVGSGCVHTIYVRKQHQSIAKQDLSDSEDDSAHDLDRTVFMTNLPVDTTDNNLMDICQALGDVRLDKFIRQGQRYGVLVLLDASSASRFLKKARKLATKSHSIEWQNYGPKGPEGYVARHRANFPEESELQEKVDEYMELFEKQEKQEQLEAQDAAERVDADGFRLVVHRGRKRLSDIPTNIVVKRKKRSLEKSDFYRFQLRDQRKQEMSDLLKRYQADKEKVEQLKQQRKYRPY